MEGKTWRAHPNLFVLTLQVWDRDVNAALNIMRVVLWQYGRTLEDRPADLIKQNKAWREANPAAAALVPFACFAPAAVHAPGAAGLRAAAHTAAALFVSPVPRSGWTVTATPVPGPAAWVTDPHAPLGGSDQ